MIMSKRFFPILLALCLAACGDYEAPAGSVGGEAPEYAAVSLEGDSVALASFRGSPVLLNVWATWCAPCRKEMPDLQRLHERYEARGLRVVGVSIDAPGADAAVHDFLAEFGITYTILRDPEDRISSLLQSPGVPVTLLIDAGGIVRWRHLGPVTSEDPGLVSAIEAALEEA